MTRSGDAGTDKTESTTVAAIYAVTGMTCAHCVTAVAEEISELAGVRAVEVDLVPGGDSQVTVISTAPLPEPAIRAAVQEAGYDLAGADR